MGRRTITGAITAATTVTTTSMVTMATTTSMVTMVTMATITTARISIANEVSQPFCIRGETPGCGSWLFGGRMGLNAKKILWVGFAVSQLILVTLGAFEVSLPLGKRFTQAIDFYTGMSGADSSYGFFAPGIYGQLRMRFEVIDGKGRKTSVHLDTPRTHESAIRVGNIIDQFWEPDETEDEGQGIHRSLVTSLAGKVLARHPGSNQVTAKLEQFEPVSMDEFRNGLRSKWKEVYEATFAFHPSR
jgi:hypothetical protein